MDLPPTPLLFRRHHHLRYENFLPPPDFIPPPYPHNLPPPPPPQIFPPHVILPPPPPRPPPTARHIARPLPPRFTFSPPQHPINERSHIYELDPPPNRYFDGALIPPSPPPPRENIPLRIIHDYPERNPIFRDNIFHRGDNRIHEFPENQGRNLQLGARELHSRVSDIGIGEHERHRDVFYQSRELCIKRDDVDRWDSGISDWGHDLYNRRDYEERRWDNGMSDQGRDLYNDRDYDERRWDNGMNDQGRDLYSDRDYEERRWDNGMTDQGHDLCSARDYDERKLDNGSTSQGCELYCEGGDGDRRWIYSRPNGDFFQFENRHPEFVKNDLSLGRFRGSLGRGPRMGNFNNSIKKDRLQRKRLFNRIHLGKDCSRRSGGLKQFQSPKKLSRGSLKGKEKGVERLQTRMEDKREREQSPMELDISFKSNSLVAKAILTPSHPAVKSDINLYGSSSAKSSKAVELDFQSDLQKASADLQDKAAVSGSGSVTVKDATDFGESAPKKAHLKVINSQGPSTVGCGMSRSSRSRKKKRARKQLMRKADLQMEINSDDIMNAKDCTNVQSAVSQHNSDTAVSKGNLSAASHGGNPGSLPSLGGTVSGKAVTSDDSCRSFVRKMKRKRSSLTTAPASSCETENAFMECSGHAEKGSSESVDQHTRLDSGADDINEHPVLGGLTLYESSFVKGPSEVTSSIEGHDSDDSSRPQETRTPEVHEDKYLPEHHELISSPNLDCAVMQTPEVVLSFDAGSKDANSKDIFLDHVELPQVGVDAKEFKSLECAPISDCSNVGLGYSISPGFLSADHKGIISKFDVSSSVGFGTSLSHNIDAVGGSPELICNGETCLSVDCSSKIIRKRKARGAQMDLSFTMTDVGVGTVRSIGGDLTADFVPSVEVDFLGEKDSSKEDDSLKEGSAGVDDVILGDDFGGSGTFPGYQKKRKLSSPTSSLSSLSEDDTIADGVTTNPSILDQQPTREVEWVAEEREDTLSASADINQCGAIDVEDRDCDYASDSSEELLAFDFDMRSCMSSPEQLLAYSDLSFTRKTEASAWLSENEMICGNDKVSSTKPAFGDPNIWCPGKPIDAAVKNLRTNADSPPLQLEDASQVVKKLNPAYGKLTWSRNQLTSAVPKVIPGRNPLNLSNSRKLYPVHATQSRTWRRTGNSSDAVSGPKLLPPPVPQSRGTKVARTTQSSYVRKGNSLVRNSSISGVNPPGFHGSSGSVYRLTPSANTVKRNKESNCNTDGADARTPTRIQQINTSEMTKLPSQNHSGMSLTCTPCSLGESLPVGNPSRNSSPCNSLDALEESSKTSTVPECRTDSVIDSNSQIKFEEGNSEKKIMYVQRRSNQLVATSNSDDAGILGVHKNKSSLSDGYYKSRKNQLVRASSKNLVRKGGANGNALRLASHSILPKTSTRRQPGFGKACRYSKVSLVWKLHDALSTEKDKTSLGPQKVWPHLFPLRRASCWRSLILGTKSSNNSFSTVGQKLLLSRKRGAIYTRSTHGYSLRMSKILSVGGSSLKWSKSIEKNSQKANEEATRAVAAAQKRKKEEKGAAPVASKSRNHVSRERIFRIGSERYKMDTTRRTLHRITEKEPSSSVSLQSEKNVKRTYIPRRLLIGNEEYVRIGNGNQLVRDPKKRTRVLASEKVRWSLRTARLRLARKRKYCQFFTRFGKCNKDDGKCPYIHDPSKIAVCTKFLSGSCSNLDCKLTHKVIPERMQDCSYFLKGSCSNENCPYRHVNVDPDSTVCESFLRGYCADGNECRKKHTYVCPAFEATGICPQESTCKLHHPKKKTEKKPTDEQKTVRGRYFDGGLIGLADSIEASTEKLSCEGKVDIVIEGKYPDYISLDVGVDEGDNAQRVELGIFDRDSSVADSSPVNS